MPAEKVVPNAELVQPECHSARQEHHDYITEVNTLLNISANMGANTWEIDVTILGIPSTPGACHPSVHL